MSTTIFTYSGTGNSLWIAQKLAEELDQATVASMNRKGSSSTDSDCIGFVFPVHIWGVPHAVLSFINNLELPHNAYLFAVAVNAGQVSGTVLQMQSLLKKRGHTLQAGYSACMPSNYIPWGGPGPVEQQQQRIDR